MSYDLRNQTKKEAPVPPISQGTNEDENKEKEEEDDNSTSSNEDTPAPPTTVLTQDDDKSTPRDNSSGDESIASRKYWDGEPPEAEGTIAQLFANEPEGTDWDDYEDLVEFLYSNVDENKANKLQFNTHLMPFLAAIPGSVRRLRVVYGIGTGIGLTGIHSNELENTLLTLTGELEEGVMYPSVLKFPPTALTPHQQKIPSNAQFTTELHKGTRKAHWFKYGDLNDEARIPIIVPCPAMYINDGFSNDIDAADLFERLDATPRKAEKELKRTLHLLRTFLKASVVKYNKSDPSIYTNTDTFMLQSSTLTNKWKKHRMNTLFPSLTNKSTPLNQSPTSITTPSLTLPTPKAPANEWNPESFMKAFAAMQTQSSTAQKGDQAKTTSTDETLGMGKFAFHLLLDLCGLATSNADEIIILWKQLAEKNLSKADKLAFVRRSIEDNIKWSEAKVLPLNSILTMVVNRAWEGETTLSSLTSAAKGLTPFAVPCLSESEVTTQNDMADALDAASSTTVKDHSSLKLVASTPNSFDGLVKRIKRFGNLLYAIFGDTSSLFMQMEDMIVALDSYGEYARSTMTTQTIASILWITHLQARHYSAGAMKGDKAIKAEFTTMMNAIITKSPVVHMDTPPSLFQTPKPAPKRPHPPQSDDTETYLSKKKKGNDNADRFQLVDRNVMNNKMKVAMAPIMNLPRVPNMGRICRAARTNAGALFPKHKDICIRSQVLGKCFVSCAHKHVKLDDNDIETALKLLDSAITNPSLFNKVN